MPQVIAIVGALFAAWVAVKQDVSVLQSNQGRMERQIDKIIETQVEIGESLTRLQGQVNGIGH